MVDLRRFTPGFRPVVGLALDPSGQIAGSGVVEGDDRPRAFRIRGNGTFEVFRPPFRSDESRAHGINGRGVAVGWTVADGEAAEGFVWEPDGRVRRLGANTLAQAVDAGGGVVGIVDGRRAVRWPAGSDRPEDLARLPAHTGDSWSWASATNDVGIVVGCAGPGAPRRDPRPVLWSSDRDVRPLPLPPGAHAGCATALQAGPKPLVVGVATIGTAERAVVWTDDETVVLLRLAPGSKESVAQGLDTAGGIVGALDRARAVRWPRFDAAPEVLFGSDAGASGSETGSSGSTAALVLAQAVDREGRILAQRLEPGGPSAVLLVPARSAFP